MATPPLPGPPPVPKKSNTLLIVLLVFCGLLVLGVLAVVGGGLFVFHKLKESGNNPGMAAAKMLATLNPDIDVVSTDDARQVMTVHDKKTGKTFQINFDDVKNGRLSIIADGKEQGTVELKGSAEQGSIQVKGPNGEVVQLGAAAAGNKAPLWVPTYPGSRTKGIFSAKAAEGNKESGAFAFDTSDNPAKVADYVGPELEKHGFKSTRTETGGIVVVTGRDDAEKREVTFTITPTSSGSSVNVGYTSHE